jgi:hypothetical protein
MHMMMNPLKFPSVKSKIPISSIIKNTMLKKGLSFDLKIAFIKLNDRLPNYKTSSFFLIHLVLFIKNHLMNFHCFL